VNVLFFSAMTVSPIHGGQTVFKFLEPPPLGHRVYYAVERFRAIGAPPFAEIAVCYFSERQFHLRGQRFRLVRLVNERLTILAVRRQLKRIIKKRHIDLLLACPQTGYDLVVAQDLARSSVPTVVWFMDDYYSSTSCESAAQSLWDAAKARLVISDAMQNKLRNRWGKDCHVLRYPADFGMHYPSLEQSPSALPLRIVYTGSLQPYYQGVMTIVMDVVSKLGGQVTLDIFTPDPLPNGKEHSWCTIHDVVPQSELPTLLAQYDLLLMLSSFEAKWRDIAETSLGSKLADYLACGRPILFYGPTYAENVGYARRHELGIVVDSEAPEPLAEALLELAMNSRLRQELARRAWEFGRVHHDRTTNRAEMWTLLTTALDGDEDKGAIKRISCPG
jgi:glycosyltransferase involved in cell wall biosynthesis